ncbi:MAG: NAD-dependent epimerase/dehydratase family protein [Hyphomicrobiales bacterium]|nr:NAD-dependent epimerase/dehydratase family protein [Hyphomicrobiales bacterium]MBV9053173.1 NAD-dependent epimerase/dehydratase family protein [Hyphomicrobiales bacterium]MBV9753374.1 NAD-dependent epimerase/dehydratase family protein [Hyphomicrobiales bacterium]MBV9976768.1 NAD-dependent epimerase/dehydratase family protein [Hyphomicrobiales bacterium]
MRAKLSSSLGADVFHAKKRVLVAGGAGFLGSHLCERLVKHEHEVMSRFGEARTRRGVAA